ncbi:MAG TPA: rhamnulokinase family protein, partial [Bacillota bacterium]|nr:rhamnulokinase family protein [Bacillota bacterium]
MKRILAFDFGASNGRAIIAQYYDEKLTVTEVHRFPNTPVSINDTLYWDVLKLYDEIKISIRKAQQLGGFDSIGIDTWGLDFGIIGTDGALVQNPVHYRDSRTSGIAEETERILTRSELYKHTGIQFMSQNTIYQLYYLFTRKKELMKSAKKILMMPDLFAYFLTGCMKCEYTNATTTGLVNAQKHTWDEYICTKLGIDTALLPEIIEPGSTYGLLSEAVANELGCGRVPVIAVGTHDTASAVVSIPAKEKDFLYISCGTWSLLGTELSKPYISDTSEKDNFTNEGGCFGTIRFLKNICGLWLIQQSKRIWQQNDPNISYAYIEAEARKAKPFQAFIDPDAPDFVNPNDMPEAIRSFCKRTHQPVPETIGQTARVIYDSLALKYRYISEKLSGLTGKKYSVMYMVGG